MVKQHLFSRLPNVLNPITVEQAVELASFLDASDIRQWVDPFVRALTSNALSPEAKATVRQGLLSATTFRTPNIIDEHIDKRLNEWIAHLHRTGFSEDAEDLQKLQADIQSDRLPF